MKRETNSRGLLGSGASVAAVVFSPPNAARRPAIRLRWAAAVLAIFVLTLLAGSAQAQRDVITTFAGAGASGAYFGQPTGVATDGAGNFYVADASYCVIWKISGGTATEFAGSENCSVLQYPIDVSTCGGNVYFITHGADYVPYGEASSSTAGAVYKSVPAVL